MDALSKRWEAVSEVLNLRGLSESNIGPWPRIYSAMIRKLKSGQYRLYSRKKDPDTRKHRNLGTFDTAEKAKQHERDVQYFKRQ